MPIMMAVYPSFSITARPARSATSAPPWCPSTRRSVSLNLDRSSDAAESATRPMPTRLPGGAPPPSRGLGADRGTQDPRCRRPGLRPDEVNASVEGKMPSDVQSAGSWPRTTPVPQGASEPRPLQKIPRLLQPGPGRRDVSPRVFDELARRISEAPRLVAQFALLVIPVVHEI